MKKALFAMLTACAVATGCATTYGPSGLDGGYSEMRRDEGIYVVRFQGNGFTKPEEAEEMVFLRAAELTIQKGFKYFSILGDYSRTDSTTVAMPGQTYTTGTVNAYGAFQARSTSTGGIPLTIKTPNSRLHIGMANAKFSPDRMFYEAAGIVQDLGPKYKK